MKNSLAETGSNITWGGATTCAVGFISQIEWVSIVGVLIAVGGFVMNWHYGRQRNRREADDARLKKEKHDLEIELLKKRIQDAEQD